MKKIEWDRNEFTLKKVQKYFNEGAKFYDEDNNLITDISIYNESSCIGGCCTYESLHFVINGKLECPDFIYYDENKQELDFIDPINVLAR